MIKTFRFDNDSREFSANSYVVIDNNDCVIIDLGATNNRIIDFLKENKLNCKGILLTHGHWDHMRGISKFLDEFPNTTIFIDENDDKCLIDSKLNCSIVMGEKNIINVEPYRIEDGDELKFSSKLVFKVIETPFHTLGSVCYFFEEESALFTGDTLFKGDVGRSDLPHSASRLQTSSLRKLKLLDPEITIYPGHGDISTLKNEFKKNVYLK